MHRIVGPHHRVRPYLVLLRSASPLCLRAVLKGAMIATTARWPGSLQRVVRPTVNHLDHGKTNILNVSGLYPCSLANSVAVKDSRTRC